MVSFIDRMFRAAKLEPGIYEEVEADPNSLSQAAGVVLLSSVAAGIGYLGMEGAGPGFIQGTIFALIAWLIWAFLTWLIGTKLLPEAETKADIGELLRTIGFSSAPGILRIGGIIPVVGGLVMFIGSVWMLVAMVVAVRQALDYTSTWRALGVCVIGWLVLVAVQLVLIQLFGSARPG